MSLSCLRAAILPSLIAVLISVGLPAFAQKAPNLVKQPFTIGFYNAENLFDTEDDPNIIDEEYLPTSELKWDSVRYQAKVTNLSRVIDSLGGLAGPDLIGMCEIENRHVLIDLTNTKLLKPKGYSIIHQNSPDRRGIDVALLYKTASFKVLESMWIPIKIAEDTAFRTRDILAVRGVVLANGKPTKDSIYVLVNHFPSRRGGQEASDGKRAAVAAKVRAFIDFILSKNPNAKIIAMGDLNDEPTDATLTEVLKAGAKPESAWPKGYLYNAMWDLKAAKQGTLFYRGDFNMLDQMLLTEGFVKGKGLVAQGGGTIYNPHWVQQHDEKYKGAPMRTYVGKRYFGGFSDHFPVYLHLSK